MSPAITPTTINTTLPTVLPAPLLGERGAAPRPAPRRPERGDSGSVGALVSVPPWSSRNGGYSSRIRST